MTETYARDEAETGFTGILARHLASTPGAIGAALVDAEGEAVDHVGQQIDPFDLKVAAAQWRIVLAAIDGGALGALGGPTERLVIRTDSRTFVVEALPDGYALLSILEPEATGAHEGRALDTTLREIYREAGWTAPPGAFRWHPMEVAVDDRGRPRRLRVRHQWTEVAPIGRVIAGLQPGEVGYRVDVVAGGVETTLVLGRDERWYADLPLEGEPGDEPT
jgi:hypothetical protein